MRRFSGIKRHAACGRYRIRDREVQLRLAVDDAGARVAHYSGLQLCGAIWTCPVCSPKIRQARALDADAACVSWLDAHGAGSLLLLTLTLPHDAGERLADVLASTRRAFSSLVSGRAWQSDKKKFGLRYYIRAHDVTVGPNGWHPHLHLLFFIDRELQPAQLDQLRARLFARWSGAVESLDRRAPTWAHGVVLEAARSRADAARYVCQVVTGDDEHAAPVAYELARADLKTSRHAGHRSPWQVLDDYRVGHLERDRQLWLEYEQATRRVTAIRWAVGLRAAVGLAGEEPTDEQLALDGNGGETIYTFAPNQWRALRDLAGLFGGVARCELLEAAEYGGLGGVEWYLAELGRARALDIAEGPIYGSSRPGDLRSRPRPERQSY